MPLHNDIELVVKESKKLEGRLREEFGAQGDGLGPLTHSLAGILPPQTFQQLLDVADMRNEIVHNRDQDILRDREYFIELCYEINRSLDELRNPTVITNRDPWGCLVMAILIAAPIICLMLQPFE